MRRDAARWLGITGLAAFVACGSSQPARRSSASCPGPVTIVVVAEGLHSAEGQVRMALYTTSDGFPNRPEKALQWRIATMADSTAVCSFDPAPCGTYAVSVFHDEDGDGEMKTDFLGRPREGWGVSRDARGRFGPPSFDDAVFAAEDETTRVVLTMEY